MAYQEALDIRNDDAMTWLRLVCRGAVATALASGDVMRMRMARTPLFHDRVMVMPSMMRVSVLMVVGIDGGPCEWDFCECAVATS